MLEQRLSNRFAQAAGFRNHHVALLYRPVIKAPRRIANDSPRLDYTIAAPRAGTKTWRLIRAHPSRLFHHYE
jgi:hypothetical protein